MAYNRYNKYLVMITGYDFVSVNTHDDLKLSYEQLHYKQVLKRSYHVLAKDKVKAINTARFELLLRENITEYHFDLEYYVKKVKTNHYKYTTKRIAKKRY